MSANDIMEMDSMTEEMEGDFEAGMIDEEVGKRKAPETFVLTSVWMSWVLCRHSLNVISKN